MAAPANINEFLDLVKKSGVMEDKRLEAYVQKARASGALPAEPSKLAGLFVHDGLLTHFQAEQIMLGKWRRFTIGKYKVLERLGSGGMGSVYLCEHKLMRRRVAVKVLPTAKAADDACLQRFYREARAVAALDHPNIVHAYDIDQDENLHFLVMEYVDGSSLQDIIKRTGPMEVFRAAHYIRQAALGLEHAHAAGLVHRDIKPGNILVDRSGVVKILDMGLARFFNDEDDVLTRKFDEKVLGTADYLSPEQAIDSHEVDIRTDIYSLGATFYYMLTGQTPFGEGTVTQKLLWHQSRQPKPIASFRSDVPAGLMAVIDKMMAKEMSQRYQNPAAVVEALTPFAQQTIAPPPDSEMPRFSLAATGVSPSEPTMVTGGSTSPPPQKTWPTPTTKPPSGKPIPLPGSGKPKTNPPLAPTLNTVGVPVLAPPGPASEDAPWEALASDTAAHLDTGANSVRRVLKASTAKAQAQERRRLGLIAAVITILALAGLAFGFWKYFSIHSAPGRQTRLLLVTKDASQPNSFRTIARALAEARSGDIIEIGDEEHVESLNVDPSRGPTAVTIQAAPGKQVVWKPSDKDERRALIALSKASRFVLRGPGITLDGTIDKKRRLNNLITVYSYCPGLTLEDLDFQGFNHSAVTIMNCQGEEGKPVRLLKLRAPIKDKKQAGLFFNAEPSITPPFNDYIEIGPDNFPGVDPALAFQRKDNVVNGSHINWPGK
jgi:serine/threonine protein kinase